MAEQKDIQIGGKQEEKGEMRILAGLMPSHTDIAAMEWSAKKFYEAGVVPKGLDSAPKLIVAIQAGAAMGLTPIQSVGCIGIIAGRPMVYGNMPFALAKRHGHNVTWGKCDETQAEVTVKRGDNQQEATYKLTMETAKVRGLNKSPVWTSHPGRMLRYAAFRELATYLLADVFNGITIGEDEEVAREIIIEQDKKSFKTTVGRPQKGKSATVVSATGVIKEPPHGNTTTGELPY